MALPRFDGGTGDSDSATMDAAGEVLFRMGFHVGREVETIKRTTKELDIDGKTMRHDVAQNTKAIVVGYDGALVRVSASLTIKDKPVPAEFNMRSDMLKLTNGKGDDSAPSKPEAIPAKATVSPFAFLNGDGDVSVKSIGTNRLAPQK